MSWTPDMVDTAARLWAEGLSASQIAGLMHVTRNAVIGVAHRKRERFPARPHPIRAARTNSPARGPSSRAVKTGAATPPRAAPVASSRSRPRAPSALACAGAPETSGGLRSQPRPAAEAVAWLPVLVPMGFLEAAERGRCLHFIGDPMSAAGPDMPVCGAERSFSALPDNRYCPYHIAASAGEGTRGEKQAHHVPARRGR